MSVDSLQGRLALSAQAVAAAIDPTCTGTTVDQTVSQPNLADQLTAANKTWKGYFQSLPPSLAASPVSSAAVIEAVRRPVSRCNRVGGAK